jgi:glutamate-1-semialdehyde 2,1-aminomutase
MFSAFFSDRPVYDYATAAKSNTDRFARYFNVMLENGVYLAPSQFEAGFMSSAHGTTEIERTIKAAEKAFASL